MSCGLDICYCQSNSIIYNILYCFNTSHVTLYQNSENSLMPAVVVSIHLMLLFIVGVKITGITGYSFQYISCYSLSFFLYSGWLCILSFQYISCYSLSEYYIISKELITVSIHLMLLFISCTHDMMEFNILFQYISCYSLSGMRDELLEDIVVSIHLMLLFISESNGKLCIRSFVSIHLMLLFI